MPHSLWLCAPVRSAMCCSMKRQEWGECESAVIGRLLMESCDRLKSSQLHFRIFKAARYLCVVITNIPSRSVTVIYDTVVFH